MRVGSQPVGGHLRRRPGLCCSVLAEFAAVARDYLRFDAAIAAIVLILALVLLPGLARTADNPQMLEAFVDDEVWQALALDGTLRWPYGNPANYLDPTGHAYATIPATWGDIRYPGTFYYGGAFYAVAAPVYAVLRAAGAPAFPTVIIVLRAITLLTALLGLVFLYNFARIHASKAVGILAVLFVAADPNFVYYTAYAHPDQLQVLLGLVALALAIRHARGGDDASLVALGLACGFVQGTKLGGAWTVPMAVLALWWGMQAVGLDLGERREAARRLIALGLAALAGWVISTPYGFVDLYYAKRAAAQLLVQGPAAADGPFGRLTMWSWWLKIYQDYSLFGLVLCGLAIARIAALIKVPGRFQPLALALVLCASQLAVYGSGKYWVVLGYLLLAIGLMAVLAFDTLVVLVRYAALSILREEPAATRVTAVLLTVGFILLYPPYALAAVSGMLDPQMYRSSTQVALNRWAEANVARDKAILFDAYAYFDPQRFSRVVRSPHPNWRKVTGYDPDYLVLSSGVYDFPLYRALIKQQKRSADDTDQFSVRLYQDLLRTEQLGPTGVQGVEYVADIAPAGLPPVASIWVPQVQAPGIGWALGKLAQTEAMTRLVAAKAETIWSPSPVPVVGAAFRVYRFNPPGTPNGRPAAIASSAQPGREARYAFDGSPAFWAAASVDQSAAYVGYDFGDHSARPVREVRVQWVGAAQTPDSVAVAYSDDGTDWTVAGSFPIAPLAAGAKRVDALPLPAGDPHRFWRLQAHCSAMAADFAVAELYFDREPAARR